MQAQEAKARTFTGNSGKAKGREFSRRNGEKHYINHTPHFSVHYYPQLKPEQVWYKTWDEDMIAYGRTLLSVYDDLKANSPEIIQESEGPQDADNPYIEKIEYRTRL